MLEQKLLLRVDEAADVASVSKSMAYQLIATGEWPSLRLGRTLRVPVVALVQWIEDRIEGGDVPDDGRPAGPRGGSAK